MEEFQSGIKRLRGEAKSKDILRLPLGRWKVQVIVEVAIRTERVDSDTQYYLHAENAVCNYA